ncbi:MAG: hypothetical protein VKJ64_08390 [Leptolyngbyaceae bacterium]|nr:hypothetical protein [Leptolyngbyaceae bacterium]
MLGKVGEAEVGAGEMSSSRYQSRVLQAIAQQTLKLRDRTLKQLRQLRLTLTWSAQILLYPVYVVLQSSRLVGKQISQATQRIFPQLAAILDPQSTALAEPGHIPVLPESDRPIHTLAKALGRTKNEERGTRNEQYSLTRSPAHPLTLATLIADKKLVLVDSHNTIHDVLTFEQQQQLHQWIVVEMANYWCDRREYIAFQIKQSRAPRFLPIPQERPTMLPPVRYLRRFIAWMQTSPLAIATSLFQESALVSTHPSVNDSIPLAQLPLDLWFDPDYHGSEDGWFNANQFSQVRRQREFPPVVPSLPARIGLTQNGSYPGLDNTATEMTGEHWLHSASSTKITAADLTAAAAFPESAIALFVEDDPNGANTESLDHYLAHHGVAYDFRRIENPAVDREMLDPMPSAKQPGPVASAPPNSPTVETTAELVAYEKHPLERLLGWIDHGMTWIETGIARVWLWLRDRF